MYHPNMNLSDFAAYLRAESPVFLTPEQIADGAEICRATGAARVYALCGGEYYGDCVFVTPYALTPRMVDGVRATVNGAGVAEYSYQRPENRKALLIRVEELARALGV